MRRLSVFLLLMVCISASSVAGLRTRVTGKIVDEKGSPVRTATVRVRGQRATSTAPVAFNGTFEIFLESEEISISADVTAPGFEKRNRTLVVVNGTADADTLTMTAAKALSLSGFTVTQSGDGKRNHLDVFVQNEADKPVVVTSVRVQGMRRAETSCMDHYPGLLFTINDQLWAGRVAAAVTSAQEPDSVAAQGTFLNLGCGQQQLDVTIPYSFSFDRGEQTKVRIAIPAKLRAKEAKKGEPVNLDAFAHVTMTLNVVNGPGVTVTRKITVKK